MNKETKAQRRRRYYLHYNLKKKGFRVAATNKTVRMNHAECNNVEGTPRKWLDELKGLGYSIQLEI